MTSPGCRRSKRKLKRQCVESDDDMEETLSDPEDLQMTRSKGSASEKGGGRQNQGDNADEMCELKQSKIDREELFALVEGILHDRTLKPAEKLCSLREGLSNAFDSIENGHDEHIVKLNQIHVTEIAKWNDECNSLRKANEALQRNCEKLTVDGMSIFENLERELQGGKDSFKNCLEEVEATKISVQDAEHDQKNHIQQTRMIDLIDSPELIVELDERSHALEFPKRLKVRSGGNKSDNVSGSYRDGCATPNLLEVAFSSTTSAVKRFQKELFEIVKLPELEEAAVFQIPNIYFVRQRHLSQYVKSLVCATLFEGFENENFNVSQSSSQLSPSLRQENFFKYYLHHREQNSGGRDIEDPQFVEFYKAKFSLLWKKTIHNTPLFKFFELETNPGVKSTFTAAAKTVWLLHKLAFSFKRPASILRVEVGADFDEKSMTWGTVQPEDNEHFISEVGFMITPGLLLRKTVVMQCEVYPASEHAITKSRLLTSILT